MWGFLLILPVLCWIFYARGFHKGREDAWGYFYDGYREGYSVAKKLLEKEKKP